MPWQDESVPGCWACSCGAVFNSETSFAYRIRIVVLVAKIGSDIVDNSGDNPGSEIHTGMIDARGRLATPSADWTAKCVCAWCVRRAKAGTNHQ